MRSRTDDAFACSAEPATKPFSHQAETIITSAGFGVRKTAIRQKQTFVAKYGVVSGTIHVIAQSAGPRACYEWQYSLDAGKSWVQVPNTL